jgi:hypothetical protein
MPREHYPQTDTDFDRTVGYEQEKARIRKSELLWRFLLKSGFVAMIFIFSIITIVIVLEYVHPAQPSASKQMLDIVSQLLDIVKVMFTLSVDS